MTLHLRYVTPLLVATCLVATWSVWPTAQTAEERVEELRSQADQGHADAQYSLGVAYYNGAGVPQNATEAVRWFRLAADQGHADAQYILGIIYANGRGVPQNDVMAYMWINFAASRSDGELRERLADFRDEIAARLTPDQLVEGQRLALEWDAAHPQP